MRLQVSTRAPTTVAAFCLAVGSTVFEDKVKDKDDLGSNIF
jgi:hypothetical protein